MEARSTTLRHFISGSIIVTLVSATSYLVGLFLSWVALEFAAFRLTGFWFFGLPDPERQVALAIWLVAPALVSACVGGGLARRRGLFAAAGRAMQRHRWLRVAVGTIIVAYLITWVVGVPRVLSEQRGIRWVAQDISVATYDHVSCCAVPVLPFVVVNYHNYRTNNETISGDLFSGVEVSLWYGSGVKMLAVFGGDLVYVPGVLKTTNFDYATEPLGSEERLRPKGRSVLRRE